MQGCVQGTVLINGKLSAPAGFVAWTVDQQDSA